MLVDKIRNRNHQDTKANSLKAECKVTGQQNTLCYSYNAKEDEIHSIGKKEIVPVSTECDNMGICSFE